MQVGTLSYKGQTVIEVFLRIFGERGEEEECSLTDMLTFYRQSTNSDLFNL